YGGGQIPDGPGGSKFFKMGTLVKAGETVTVTVARSARSYLKLQQGSSNLQGEMSVVFQACPGSSYTGWVAGSISKVQHQHALPLTFKSLANRNSDIWRSHSEPPPPAKLEPQPEPGVLW
ncbi:MAG: hypothetical protein ACR2P2_00265, partial [Nakamurella sp.]